MAVTNPSPKQARPQQSAPQPNGNRNTASENDDRRPLFLIAYTLGALLFGVATVLVLLSLQDTNRQLASVADKHADLAEAIAAMEMQTRVDVDVAALAEANAASLAQAVNQVHVESQLDVDVLAQAIAQANAGAFAQAIGEIPQRGPVIDVEAFAFAVAEANAQAFSQALANVNVENHIDTRALSVAIAEANSRAYAAALANADINVNLDADKLADRIARANAFTISRALQNLKVECNCQHHEKVTRPQVTHPQWPRVPNVPSNGRGTVPPHIFSGLEREVRK